MNDAADIAKEIVGVCDGFSVADVACALGSVMTFVINSIEDDAMRHETVNVFIAVLLQTTIRKSTLDS